MADRPLDPDRWAAVIAARMPRGTAQRVRAGRRLRRAGALAVRAGVYALPDSAASRLALADAVSELKRGRGSALPCVVTWLDHEDAARLRARFERDGARRRERLLAQLEALERAVAPGSRLPADSRRTANARLARLRKRMAEPAGGPVVPVPGAQPAISARPAPHVTETPYRGRIWVTRTGVLVDRIASAWFVLRFLDPAARFHFVSPGESPPTDALRFDMAEADFGHAGDRCTFETLVHRFGSGDAALTTLAEIVHDLDLQDGKFGRPEAAGVARVIAGLAAAEADDMTRIIRGSWLFDCLHAALRSPPPRLSKGVLP